MIPVRKNSPRKTFISETVTGFHAWILACCEVPSIAWIHWSAYRLVWSTMFWISKSEINSSTKSLGSIESRTAASLRGPGFSEKGRFFGSQFTSCHSWTGSGSSAGWFTAARVWSPAGPCRCASHVRPLPRCCVLPVKSYMHSINRTETHIYIHTFMHTHTFIYIHRSCTHTCTHTYIFIDHAHTCTHTYIHI